MVPWINIMERHSYRMVERMFEIVSCCSLHHPQENKGHRTPQPGGYREWQNARKYFLHVLRSMEAINPILWADRDRPRPCMGETLERWEVTILSTRTRLIDDGNGRLWTRLSRKSRYPVTLPVYTLDANENKSKALIGRIKTELLPLFWTFFWEVGCRVTAIRWLWFAGQRGSYTCISVQISH